MTGRSKLFGWTVFTVSALGIVVAPARGADIMTPIAKVWIEGPGYDVSYGGTNEMCAQRCLDASRCVMIEYYRPEKKCNLYDSERRTVSGGSSNVAVRRAGKG